MSHNTPFTFYGSLQYPDLSSSQGAQQAGGSLKRKSSYEDISPLVMKTRTGIGLEEEIVYGKSGIKYKKREAVSFANLAGLAE